MSSGVAVGMIQHALNLEQCGFSKAGTELCGLLTCDTAKSLATRSLSLRHGVTALCSVCGGEISFCICGISL